MSVTLHRTSHHSTRRDPLASRSRVGTAAARGAIRGDVPLAHGTGSVLPQPLVDARRMVAVQTREHLDLLSLLHVAETDGAPHAGAVSSRFAQRTVNTRLF